MDSRVTLSLAAVLMLGAVAAGYWGVRQSQPSHEPVQEGLATSAPTIEPNADGITVMRTAVVMTARPIQPFVPLTPEDLVVEQLQVVPAGSFKTIEEVVGRVSWSTVPAGILLSEQHFSGSGPLAQMIHADERAIAVPIDEVVSTGHHVRPGDYVDVLLYMREDGQRPSSAQVALPALRLLSIGPILGLSNDGQAKPPTEEEAAQRRNPRTAVLAVPQDQVTRLMLASEAGVLRLAVRSADEKLLARYRAGELQPMTLDDTNRSLLRLDQLAGRPAAAPIPRGSATARLSGEGRTTVEIVRGDSVTRQTP